MSAVIRERLKGQTLMLGDQSPWAGGLLRAWAAQTLLGARIEYFLQDLDTPWFETSRRLRIKHGWNIYWSLACRYPWSFCVPGTALNDVLNTTRSPHGLGYLVGPRTEATIYSTRECPILRQHLQDLLQREMSWGTQVANWAGVEPAHWSVPSLCGAHDLAQYFAQRCGVPPVRSLLELFRDSPPLLCGELPREEFWYFGATGLRRAKGDAATFPVPRARALILEIAARGWILGCTHIPYLAEVTRLRDRYLPGLKIRLLQIRFDWEPAGCDPMTAVLSAHNRRRSARGKPLLQPGSAFETIASYWRQRPSSISYGLLGGELGPRFELLDL